MFSAIKFTTLVLLTFGAIHATQALPVTTDGVAKVANLELFNGDSVVDAKVLNTRQTTPGFGQTANIELFTDEQPVEVDLLNRRDDPTTTPADNGGQLVNANVATGGKLVEAGVLAGSGEPAIHIGALGDAADVNALHDGVFGRRDGAQIYTLTDPSGKPVTNLDGKLVTVTIGNTASVNVGGNGSSRRDDTSTSAPSVAVKVGDEVYVAALSTTGRSGKRSPQSDPIAGLRTNANPNHDPFASINAATGNTASADGAPQRAPAAAAAPPPQTPPASSSSTNTNTNTNTNTQSQNQQSQQSNNNNQQQSSNNQQQSSNNQQQSNNNQQQQQSNNQQSQQQNQNTKRNIFTFARA